LVFLPGRLKKKIEAHLVTGLEMLLEPQRIAEDSTVNGDKTVEVSHSHRGSVFLHTKR